MGKDVILERYGRLYEIPRQLARLGHEVRGFCLSYQGRAADTGTHSEAPGQLQWSTYSLGRLYLPALANYPRHLLKQLRAFTPDLIIGASDIPHVILGAQLARNRGCPFVADLYDNFEGFGQARIPGMVPLLRRAVRQADLVLTTSELLRGLVVDTYKAQGEAIVMPSAVDKAVFHPRDKLACRKALGLSPDVQLIGTAGGLYYKQGIGALYEAWRQLAVNHPSLHLALAGPVEPGAPRPRSPRIHYLGNLPQERIAELFCALDVGLACIPGTPSERYRFPRKIYEMLACDLPVVATNVGATGALLAPTPQSLYETGDVRGLARKVGAQLTSPVRPDLPISDWEKLVADIEPYLQQLIETRTNRLAS